MKCECSKEMWHIFSNHEDMYFEVHWCKVCGRLYIIDENEEHFHKPDLTPKEVTR